MRIKATLTLLSFFFILGMGACQQSKEPQTLEGKKKLLAQYQKELIEIKQKVKELEEEIDNMAADEGVRKAAVTVKVKEINAQDFKHFIQIPGNVESDDYVKVSSEVPGRITALYVEVGDNVVKGQELARIDDKMVRRQLDELTTAYELAAQTFEKQARLWKQGIGSEMQYLQAKNAKESLERKMATLKAQLDKYIIKSPITGRVDDLMVKSGEMLSPGFPLLTVINVADIKVLGEVSERYVGKFRKGDSVVVDFPVIGLQVHTTIDALGQAIDKDNRTFKVIIKIHNPNGALKPNLLANIRLFDFRQKKALLVPTRVVFFQDEGTYLYTVRIENGDTTAHKETVKLEYSDEKHSLVKEGIEAGALLIVEGYDKVSEGEKIRPLFENPKQ